MPESVRNQNPCKDGQPHRLGLRRRPSNDDGSNNRHKSDQNESKAETSMDIGSQELGNNRAGGAPRWQIAYPLLGVVQGEG